MGARPATILLPALLAGAVFSGMTATAHAQSDLARMKSEYRRPPPLPIKNPALVELGRELFFDPQLSASGKTACATCHFADLGWGVTDARSRTDSGKLTSRKSQPLIGIGYAGKAPVGWDGRSATLEAQAKSSIATGSMSMRETDTPVKVEVIEERIRSNPSYAAKFQAALPGAPINHRHHRDGDRGVRADARAQARAVRPLDRRRRAGDLGLGQARLRAVQHHQVDVLHLPHGLALHRRQVPRHRHDDHRPRPRPRRQGRRADAIRLQDADAAFGRRCGRPTCTTPRRRRCTTS